MEVKKVEIKKVLVRSDGVKVVVIPKKSDLKKGDYVRITKVEDEKIK